MSIASPAKKIQFNNVLFLTQQVTVNAADIRGYVASIRGYLWGKADGVSAALKTRVDAVVNDGGFNHWLGERDTQVTAWAPHNVVGNDILLQLQQLDHIAFDIKQTAGHAYQCTPATDNVPKNLTRTTANDRDLLDDVILLFQENSCAANEAAIQTVAHLPPPNATYRIDRENVSAAPAPRYWTYRLQIGGDVNGGILMEADVVFRLADVRSALTNSNRSVALRAAREPNIAGGNYVRLSAPAWLRGIMAAE